jgi:hypothetical protein
VMQLHRGEISYANVQKILSWVIWMSSEMKDKITFNQHRVDRSASSFATT